MQSARPPDAQQQYQQYRSSQLPAELQTVEQTIASFLDNLSLGRLIKLPRFVERLLLEEHILRLTLSSFVSNFYAKVTDSWTKWLGSPTVVADDLWVNRLRQRWDLLWQGGLNAVWGTDRKGVLAERFGWLPSTLASSAAAVAVLLYTWRLMSPRRLAPNGRMRMWQVIH
eukprot:TRINITY_DN2036_c0_g1_i1.p1 TRINITY_DN2036_c0_g1~~TRINITY_DN2036_c0_g1_i1.p1  ORF type:complete len:170 (-),score=34.82 TRINITY_DN2036_c0_g1_i1:233-742(-)